MVDTYGFEPVEEQEENEWEINADSPVIDYIKDQHKQIRDDEFNSIIQSSCNILSQCPNPNGRSKGTGLVVGRVQSGKTLSFTTLIALAAANSYKIIVVLGGTKIPLKEQTYNRLVEDLGILHTGRTSSFFIEKDPSVHNIDNLDHALQSDKCLLFVVLKHKTHINKLTEVISRLPAQPVLIIDDEGDEASLNTLFRKNEQSPIYRSIINLRLSLKRRPHVYIAYTATPQANFLISAVDLLNPDFCELIDPGSDYCGARVFFGEDKEKYIRLVEDFDEDAVERGIIPDSLKKAMAFFWVSAVIRHLRSYEKHSMLIHMNVRTDAHKRVRNSVQTLLNNWQGQIKLRSNDPSRQELIVLFRQAYDDLATTVANLPSWDTVEELLPKELMSTQIHMVNSLPDGIRLAEDILQLDNHIIIGGNILGRGLTIKNLTVSYMTRRSSGTTNADTMEQRARWFGYKRNYLDLCRIYLTDRVRTDYEIIKEHEDDFWDSLRNNLNQGISIKYWRRFLVLNDETLRPTRAAVANWNVFKPSGWEIQRNPQSDRKAAEKNLEVVDSFFKISHNELMKIGGTEHLIASNCPIDSVISMLESTNFNGTCWRSQYYIRFIKLLHERGVLNTIDVVFMRKGTPREREIEPDGSFNQLMQGRSSNNPEDASFYPGDSNIHKNRPQLQVHIIDCKVNRVVAYRTTAFALYIPEDERYKLSFIIGEGG